MGKTGVRLKMLHSVRVWPELPHPTSFGWVGEQGSHPLTTYEPYALRRFPADFAA